MKPDLNKKAKARLAYELAAKKIIEEASTTHDTQSLKESLHKLFTGWVSTPLELSPEERLDMVVHYEHLQDHLTSIKKLKQNEVS